MIILYLNFKFMISYKFFFVTRSKNNSLLLYFYTKKIKKCVLTTPICNPLTMSAPQLFQVGSDRFDISKYWVGSGRPGPLGRIRFATFIFYKQLIFKKLNKDQVLIFFNHNWVQSLSF